MPEKREDVEATLQQDTAPDTSQQKKKWRAIDWIAGGTFIAEVLWGSWWLVTQFFQWCTWNPHVSTEHFAQFYCGVGLGILSVGYLTLILWPIIFNIFKQGKDSKQDNDPRWFHARILSSGIVGGSYAFLLPAVMSLPEGGVNSGGAAALRQAILLATGGLIALIALGETRRKNDNDREAAENLRDHQQDMLNQQKKQFRKQIKKQQQQFEANAFKERKAERRERYTKAVEQLGDEKAPIRMGGVYTLVGLVDEWLEEENLSEPERLKEGQVIINNLCAYIRSPFTLAARYDELSEDNPSSDGIYKDNQQKFYADKAEFKAEADVRHSIIKEIHDRLKGPGGKDPGAWSDFEYDFSGSIFFYPVDLTTSYYKEPVTFRDSTYQGRAYFGGSIYRERANFRNSIYQGQADFSGSTYQGWTSFRNSTYQKGVLFGGSTYQDSADFGGSTYQDSADFSQSTYKKQADFSNSTYTSWANFSNSTYTSWADFSNSTYTSWANFSNSTYTSWANFSGSTYQGRAGFGGSIYRGSANFSQSTYKKQAIFNSSTYQDRVDFDGSIYRGSANFSQSTYKKQAIFNSSTYQSEAYFNGSIYRGSADFSDTTYRGSADFNGSIYQGSADFFNSIYESWADFSDSTYQNWVSLCKSTYSKQVNFGGSTYQDSVFLSDSTYQGRADFSGSTYQDSVLLGGSTYQDSADFSQSTYKKQAIFNGSTYQSKAYFNDSIYQGKAIFNCSTYQGEAVFSGSIFYSDAFLGENHDNGSSSCFTKYTPTFYQENYYQKTLFGSTNNDFTVDNDKGYPIDLNPEGIPLKCKFLTSEQKAYLEGKFQEIEKINNKLLKVKDPKEKEELSKNLQALNKELHKWREEATTVKVEDGAIENTES